MPLRPVALLAAASVFALATPPRAQVDEPQPLVVMNLAAHPDDEDGLTMAYYRHAKDAVVYSVIYTRGEGGQNEIGPDLYERLGAIRTAETEAAARVLGTQVYYLNFYDFGFSKHAEETFREWSRPRRGFWDTAVPPVSAEAGRDTVTARLVYLIRRLKPDVIFTNHDTSTAWPNAQHGHHQAVGISAFDAFALAADPSYHPEQLREPGVALWQPKRLFLRQRRPTAPRDAAVPVGDRCGVLAETCADLAVRAASLHRSQGFDKFAGRFRQDTTFFQLLRSSEGVAPLPPRATDLAAGLPPNPTADRLSAEHRIASGRLAPLTGGVHAETGVAMRRQRVRFRWDEHSGAGRNITVGVPSDDIPLVDAGEGEAAFHIDAGAPLTLPRHRAMYERMISTPPVRYTSRGEEWAGGFVALEVAPPVVVDLAPAPVRLVPGANVVPVSVRTYDPAATATHVTLLVETGAMLAAALAQETQTLTPGDTAAVFRFTLPDDVSPGRYRVTVTAEASPTSAPAEPYTETRPAAVLPDVRVAEGLRVGFVRSYDRVTEDALRAMGAEVVALDSAALAEGRFDSLHTIVLDIRAYLVRRDLRAHNARLLDWVRSGGHLVVGYHKTFEWNPGEEADPIFGASAVPPEGWAPYGLTLGRDRITYEDAPVTVLAPEHPLFRRPHAITAADWDGWVQERGLYFPASHDPRYRALLAMADPGEAPLTSGLLLAEVGRGTYAYSSLGWYRQLEALNAGAWRLFANLVSLPLVKERGSVGG